MTYALIMPGKGAWAGEPRESVIQTALNVWIDAVDCAATIGALDAKIKKQTEWLLLNATHPLAAERSSTRSCRWDERYQSIERMGVLVQRAKRLIDGLNDAERQRFDELIGERATELTLRSWCRKARWSDQTVFDLLEARLANEGWGEYGEPPF